MTSFNMEIPSGTTSFIHEQAGKYIASLSLLNKDSGTGPTWSQPSSLNIETYPLEEETTTSSQFNTLPVQKSTAQQVFEFRRISGLTWGKIAEIFGVTRRSVHFWANGKPMEEERATKLSRLLECIHKLDTGYAIENRRTLFAKDESGISLFDLFKKGDFGSADLRIVPSPTKRHISRPLSQKAREEIGFYLPVSPFDLLGADPRYIPDKPTKVSVVQIKKLK